MTFLQIVTSPLAAVLLGGILINLIAHEVQRRESVLKSVAN
jgi:hypothetical protein